MEDRKQTTASTQKEEKTEWDTGREGKPVHFKGLLLPSETRQYYSWTGPRCIVCKALHKLGTCFTAAILNLALLGIGNTLDIQVVDLTDEGRFWAKIMKFSMTLG